jgi:hypothetical protein
MYFFMAVIHSLLLTNHMKASAKKAVILNRHLFSV